MLADLQGQIERITYSNEETGYTIAKVKVYGRRDLVTVVGNFMAPMPGEILKLQGEWGNHPKFGEQFKVVHYKSLVPASVAGIEKYLGSGLIKGIGPVMAKRIVKKFEKDTHCQRHMKLYPPQISMQDMGIISTINWYYYEIRDHGKVSCSGPFGVSPLSLRKSEEIFPQIPYFIALFLET